MVRLDRITMQGFKSFANRITIPFPSGFNVIAGPNGSGKSNVIDALTFVLGTTSARTIRAQKLQNLLFNGARDRKPADFCEVSIYLDNNDGKIPGEKELKVTRRITRSGISVYKLNAHTVTRAKVLDILSYANLSSEGYNIIMQGDVTNIIEMSPLGRRSIIDEISGIMEFDDKKEKAVRELDHVDLKVRENMIVVAEKQHLVVRLKQEKESAERYQELNTELRKSKASLLKQRLENAKTKLKAFDKDIGEDSKKFDTLEKEFQKIESDLDKKEASLKKLNDDILNKSRNYEIMRKIDSINTDIIRRKDKIDINEREITRLRSSSGADNVVQTVLNLDRPGIYGTVASLIEIPKRYDIALAVAMGRHANDIVVENDDVAAFCIKYLKEKKLGRARFIPLNKIKSRPGKEYRGKETIIGYAIDLIKFNKKYEKAMQYVLTDTIVVDNIDIARRINDFRIVTLDGDLVEKSGAMIGGFYRKIIRPSYGAELRKIEDESERLKAEIDKFEKDLEKLKGLEKEESADVQKLQQLKDQEETIINTMRKRRKEIYEERLVLQNKVGRSRIEKAKTEANLDNVQIEYGDYKDITEFYTFSEDELQERTRRCIIEINKLGAVNLRAIEEYQITHVEFEELRKKLDKLLEEKEAIMNVVKDVEQKRFSKFMETFTAIALNFSKIYNDMTGGGIGRLRLEEENNIDSGLAIEASPVGKKVLNLDVMSGGEKTLTSLSFLFAIMQHSASPFYVLDEIDAALDKANTNKIANLIQNYSKNVQFIVITHNDITIAQADNVFGVSMESGVSKIFGIKMPGE
ncbi:MAG: chromosome segregation SMC family protein [Candidatus Aenigmarchaeota archaeon]|nr:chromosome segregation SMC family protein [Candidatus Aenigmarchaeota archaeon]